MQEETLTLEMVLEKYSDVPLYFSSYYKYEFVFAGQAPDGRKIVVSLGGHADDIYKMTVIAGKPMYLADEPYHIQVYENDQLIFTHYDFK